MKSFLLLICCIGQFFFSTYSLAKSHCLSESQNCMPVGQWELSLGIGAGVYTNPLHDSDNIPLIIVPKVSYYGEQFFFQNNTLGYTFVENQKFALSTIVKANTEKAFFTRWHPQNVLLPSISSDFVEIKTMQKISPDNIEKRKWAVDAGIQINWFVDELFNAEIQLLHDVNSVYNGFNVDINVSKLFLIDKASSLEVTLGTQWNSEQLVDYYYGIDESDAVHRRHLYKGKSSINPYISLGYAYQLSSDWFFKAYLKRKQLDKNTYLSPIVARTHVDLIFVGFFYEF